MYASRSADVRDKTLTWLDRNNAAKCWEELENVIVIWECGTKDAERLRMLATQSATVRSIIASDEGCEKRPLSCANSMGWSTR